ncbi:3-deoxy-manno-octulosonate cytidylyltransferase [Rubinisphaera margarita]|uniref:3-deoxy-manno-octulosonate cytidylyltransferase n=1 Tax=Rubinisphaera margarita TaxID=2909586 RepID=UPI001EE886B6|nr:3-deoxy-manno-octulosonate cytidylyltransferase [Rubinisphaera margarita]MCG6155963.1 3-deoxy-manno-octulosonate cytidylyltransferase [Rubinisphaera margarita]
MDVVGIIPARLKSSRLPGKLLLRETGRSMLEHTWQAAQKAKRLDRLIIATDSAEIAEECERFGAEVSMTGECANGTERIAVALQNLEDSCRIAVNIQGDEPEIDPRHIDRVVEALEKNEQYEMATLANPIQSVDQLFDPACVKVVCASNGAALYFSRSPIPHSRDRDPVEWFEEASPHQPTPWLQHIGLYAYRAEFVQAFVKMPAASLETIEQLEQLRALQAGAQIHVTVVSDASRGIDTPADYESFVARFQARN